MWTVCFSLFKCYFGCLSVTNKGSEYKLHFFLCEFRPNLLGILLGENRYFFCPCFLAFVYFPSYQLRALWKMANRIQLGDAASSLLACKITWQLLDLGKESRCKCYFKIQRGAVQCVVCDVLFYVPGLFMCVMHFWGSLQKGLELHPFSVLVVMLSFSIYL